MEPERKSGVLQYGTLSFIGGGVFGLAQYVMVLLHESLDASDWNGNLYSLFIFPTVFGLVSAILATKGLGNPLLNSVALLLVPLLFGVCNFAGFNGSAWHYAALLLSFGVSIIVFAYSHHKRYSHIP